MRPIPVPDYVKAAPWVQDTAVFAAPDGDLTSTQIPPAEGVFYNSIVEGFGAQMFPMVGVILELDDEDLDAIRNRGANHIMLSWHGRQMPVFTVPVVLEEGKDA